MKQIRLKKILLPVLLIIAGNIITSGCDPVPVPPPPAPKEITSFEFRVEQNPVLPYNGIGSIQGTEITVAIPRGISASGLIAAFVTTGIRVEVNAVVQVSGVTQNNFTAPVTYTVVASDGATQNYTVRIVDGPSVAKDILAFVFPAANNPQFIENIMGAINGTDITINLPYGTDVTALVPDIVISGESVSPDRLVPQSFSEPLVYTVEAEDGSTKDYTVTVVVSDISNNAHLADLDVSSGVLVPDFSQSRLNYNASVDNSVGEITVIPVAAESHSTIYVNGTRVASGTSSVPISLAVGNNTITVEVVAQDGTTILDYSIIVTRADSPADPVWHGNYRIQVQGDADALNGYTSIDGYLLITTAWPVNLTPLSSLQHVTGFLKVSGSTGLTDLSGLCNLESVGGALIIENNPDLLNINGLGGLTHVGDYIGIYYNANLQNIDGLANINNFSKAIQVIGNQKLATIAGLNNVATAASLSVKFNASLTGIPLINLAAVNGMFEIVDNDMLTGMDCRSLSLVKGDFQVYDNSNLPNAIPQAIADRITVQGDTIIMNNKP